MSSYPPDPLGRDIPFEGDEHVELTDCIRCREEPATHDDGAYCRWCHWSVQAEVDEGLYYLSDYLRRWAKFREWEEAQCPRAA